jgi:hypothetical protein
MALTAVQLTFPSKESPHDVPANINAITSRCKSKQPTAADLATYGIKVRDFAFESALPPIAPVYLQPQQIQPDPSPWVSKNNMARSSSQAGDRRKLERHPTQLLTLTRQRGFVNLRNYNPDTDDELLEWSQEPEERVKTLIVTPNGSLHGSDLPASQLELDNLCRAVTATVLVSDTYVDRNCSYANNALSTILSKESTF